jgi:phospholipase/lecithinase/hemolysin
LGADEKILGNSSDVTYTGSWVVTPVYKGLGKYSATQNDYLDVNVTGDVIYIASINQTGAQGTFSVYVDDVLKGSYSCSGGVTSGSGTGRTYSPFLIRLTGLSNTLHEIRINVTSVSGNVYFDWIAGIDSAKYVERPIFYMGNTLYFTDTGYNTYMAGSDKRNTTDIWNNVSYQVASDLTSDGLNIVYINMTETYDPDIYCCADGVHPTQAGHTHISTRYITAMEETEDYRKIILDTSTIIVHPLIQGTQQFYSEMRIGLVDFKDGMGKYLVWGILFFAVGLALTLFAKIKHTLIGGK